MTAFEMRSSDWNSDVCFSDLQSSDEHVTLYARFAAHIGAVLHQLEGEGQLPAGIERKAVAVGPPRDASHGDLATNAAMVLAKRAGTNPRALAELIAPKLRALDEVAAVEVAGPGFINVRLDAGLWRDELRSILADGADYGRSSLGGGEKVNIEYVSANPTGRSEEHTSELQPLMRHPYAV